MKKDVKFISGFRPTEKQREHVERRATETGTTIAGYIKQLINEDMKRNDK